MGSWLTQFILNLIGFHWVAHTSIEFGGFPKPVGYVILLLFACAAHLYYPIAAILWGLVSRRMDRRFAWLLIPFIFSLCELLNPTIFFWHLGYPWLWINLPAIHTTQWIGFYGLNLFTLFVNLALLITLLTRRYRYLITAVIASVAINVIGQSLKAHPFSYDKELKVLIVQANIGNAIKAEQDKGVYFHDYILRKYLEITDKGLREHPDTDLIIWPETAFPGRVTRGFPRDLFQNKLRYSINTLSTPLLSGAYEEDTEKNIYNSLVLFDKKGLVVDSYRKTFLLAFGEFFPGAEYYPQLKDWFPMVSDFGRGKGPQTMDFEGIRMGAQICYESLFDDFSKKLVQQGAQIIVNVTNDSWFGTTAEPYQHGYMTLARALEFKVPLVRSTNTGISTVITAEGVIGEKSPLHQEWFGHYVVPYSSHPERTLYSYYAGFWPYIISFFTLIVIIGGLVVKTRKS
ncbi:MAG: apolipoprotein N-acyltransferase [Bdellovibrionaceae bacterium]|nr:apolipoprotein N-acyltransferase [Pseudobdellovibrionaceae bacterium]